MTLEAVVFPQDTLTSYNSCSKEYNLCTSNDFDTNIYDFATANDDVIYEFLNNPEIFLIDNNDNVSQWEEYKVLDAPPPPVVTMPAVSMGDGGARKKRRRRSGKNKEEVEQQRMTHITVEKNRRKQMNEYLATIRSLIPPSYVQRGDQASIVGGAINYVKELEQLLQSMEAQHKSKLHQCDHNHQQQPQESQNLSPPIKDGNIDDNVVTNSWESSSPPLFANFFSFPQYSTRSNNNNNNNNNSVSSNSGVGEIEVTIVESHANVKILTKKQPKQLVKLISSFQALRLIVLHLNLTTIDDSVLYSLSLKVEEECQLNSVEDIAAVTNHILTQIQDEAALLI